MQFSAEVCDRLDYFDYDVVGFPLFFMAVSLGIPLAVFMCLNYFASPEHISRVGGFNNRHKFLTAKLLMQS